MGLSFMIVHNSLGQNDKNFWQRLFGKKSETMNVEEPKNSQDSLATLIHNHLGNNPSESNGETTPADGKEYKRNPQTDQVGDLTVLMDDRLVHWLDTISSSQVNGFRIQVFMGDLTQARKVRSGMLGQGERATLDYNDSDYYVRIGDYRSYIQAEEKLISIKDNYPGAYVVRDKIKLK